MDNVETLDVREHINSGREPFSVIMQAVSRLETGQKLLLIAPFEPAPLYSVMARKGFEYSSKPRDDGDWEALFSPFAEEEPGTTIDLDVRGLEPPEPLVKILEAVAAMPERTDLRAHTDRRPVHLYSQLEERGYTGESQEQPDGSFVTLIRTAHLAGPTAA